MEAEVPPQVETLLTYARALVVGARLDELGCLTRLVERTCAGSLRCVEMLRAFADGVDALVMHAHDGARFHPLGGIRAALGLSAGCAVADARAAMPADDDTGSA